MNLSTQLAKQFREVYFGGNWTWSNMKENLGDVTREEAVAVAGPLNTILKLTYHIHYFVSVTLKVLEGGPLDAHDKFSFDHPAINSDADWAEFLKSVWADGEKFAALVEQLPDEQLWTTFCDEKYGTWYRNIQGIIEHTHYHLGQIAIVKKLVRGQMGA
jgi:hypothetical protein